MDRTVTHTEPAPSPRQNGMMTCIVTVHGRDGGDLSLIQDLHGTGSSRWYLVNVGRYFDSPAEACEYLAESWDREPNDEELWREARAEATYRCGYDYACGYHD